MKPFSFFLLSLIILSCKTKDDSSVPNEYAAKFIKELNPTDTFLFDFSVNKKGVFDTLDWYYLKEFEKHLELPSLEKGFDSIQIRIDFDCVRNTRESLVILTNDGKGWMAELSNVHYHYSENMKVDSITREVINAIPKSGWINFINELFDLKILTIEDNYKIPGFEYSVPNDGCGIGIEVATKNVYRFYSYDNPSLYDEKHWQAANVIAIQNLLYEEFDILKIWDNQTEEARIKYVAEKERKREENRKSGKKVIIYQITDTTSEK
jgi:hypothetical protein